MPTDCTITYPDADSTSRGELYLPGDPLPAALADESCQLCDCPIDATEGPDGALTPWAMTPDAARGVHLGIVVDVEPSTLPDAQHWPMHLRCLVDAGEQLGSVGLVVGPLVDATGRHAGGAA